MKTVFGLFSDYTAARSAVEALRAADFDQDEMNVIIQSEVAKDRMEVDMERAKVDVTDEVGEVSIHGLDAMLAGEQPVNLPDVGDVFASGQLATILTTTSAAPGEADGGLETTLMEFNLSADIAGRYRAGVEAGDLLFFIRTSDERASAAADILKEQHAQNVAGYAG